MFNFRMLLVSMLLLVVCCPFASYAEIDEAAMMANARAHYQEGGYYYATTWLERILKNWPKTPQREEVLLMMAKSYAATGREEKALQTVKTLQKDFPQSSARLDPKVLKFVEEVEGRKLGYSREPELLPATPPAAKEAAEPAPAPTEAASLPVPSVAVAPPPAVPVAVAAQAVTAVPLEKTSSAKAESAASSAAAVPEPAVAKAAAPEAPNGAPAPAEPAPLKASVELKNPPVAEAAASPAAAIPEPKSVEVAAPQPPTSDPAPAEPAAVKASVEAQVLEKGEAAAPPVAPAAEPAPASVAAVEAPKAIPVPEEPAAVKVPAEAVPPAQVEAAAAPAEQSKGDAKADTAAGSVVAAAPAEPAAAKPVAEVKGTVAGEAAPAALPASEPGPASADAAIPPAYPKEVTPQVATAPQQTCNAGWYALDLGEYVGQNTLVKAKKAVRKAGLEPVVGQGPRNLEMMLRIQVGEFKNQESAEKLLKKLRDRNEEHFMLKNKAGIVRVFAGSYSDHLAAAVEQQRLAAKGIKSELKLVEVPVPTNTLSAGCFPTEEAAQEKMSELKRLGLKGKVMATR